MKSNFITTTIGLGILLVGITTLTACDTMDDSNSNMPEVTAPKPVPAAAPVKKSVVSDANTTTQDQSISDQDNLDSNSTGHKLKIIKYHHNTDTTTASSDTAGTTGTDATSSQ